MHASLARFVVITVLGLPACTHKSPPPATPLPGTYALELCRVRCAGARDPNTLAVGRLVLLDSAMDTTALRQDSAGRILADFFIFDHSDAAPNGCFLWDTRREKPTSYATGFSGGLIHWVRSGDSVRFQLYSSPDAGHYVTLALGAADLRGRGVSSGYGADSIPQDVLVARRTGPPEPSICPSAGRALWEDIRRYNRELADSARPLHN